MKKGTIKQLAESFGIEGVHMNGAIHFLTKIGAANKIGFAPKAPNVRGKNSAIYEIVDLKKAMKAVAGETPKAPKKATPKA
jgi:hypothetical protein